MTSIFSALLTAFNLLMHPKLLLLALWPMLASVVVWVGAALFFWGRWADPNFSAGWIAPFVYPLKWLGGAAMFLALLLALIVFIQGTQHATAKKR